jgi:hypothetical protein
MMTGRQRKPGGRSNKRTSAHLAGSIGPTEARLAVNLPLALHRQLKARAAERGQSIRDYVLELLRSDGIGR